MTAALLREALATARSQVVATGLTLAVVAGMCAAVLLTTGQTVAAEEAALDAIDAVGTRSVVVRSSDETSLTAGMLDRLAVLEGVDTVVGFGAARDVRNARVEEGSPVPSRTVLGALEGRRMSTDIAGPEGGALATEAAVERLGFLDGTGTVVDADGIETEVVGRIELPDHLGIAPAAVLVPASTAESLAGADPHLPLAVVSVVASSPSQVDALAAAVRGMLADANPESVTVETSAELAAIRDAVSGELGRYGRGLILGILAVSALLVSVNMSALVMMRRKDFGRRRALGASRGLLMSLLLTQVGATAALGAAAGGAVAVAALVVRGDPVPGGPFTVAVAALSVLVAVVATLPPALWAARRDPLRELRVP